jgi:hypothetical protein
MTNSVTTKSGAFSLGLKARMPLGNFCSICVCF